MTTEEKLDKIIEEIGETGVLVSRSERSTIGTDAHDSEQPRAYPGRKVNVTRAKANVIKMGSDAVLALTGFVGG